MVWTINLPATATQPCPSCGGGKRDKMKHRQQMAIALSEIGSPNPSFLTKLFELIAKADYVNKPRLRSAFTAEVDFFDEWYSRPDGPAWLGRVARGEEE